MIKERKAEPTEIDGIWKVESAEGDPVQTKNLVGTTFWFGEGIAVGRFMKDVPFTVDVGKEPKWLDLLKMQFEVLTFIRKNEETILKQP